MTSNPISTGTVDKPICKPHPASRNGIAHYWGSGVCRILWRSHRARLDAYMKARSCAAKHLSCFWQTPAAALEGGAGQNYRASAEVQRLTAPCGPVNEPVCLKLAHVRKTRSFLFEAAAHGIPGCPSRDTDMRSHHIGTVVFFSTKHGLESRYSRMNFL